jgi:hypothetical protein
MRRIVTAAVEVGIFTIDGGWAYGQVNSYAAVIAVTPVPDPIRSLDDFSGPHIARFGHIGSGHWRSAEEADRQHATHQRRCE